MNKSVRTLKMEKAVSTYFEKEYGIHLESEVKVRHGLVDFLGALYDEEGKAKDVIAVEIKQSIPDFYTNCGLNFVGSSNYLAVPAELVGYAVTFLREHDRNDVGVLEINTNGKVKTITFSGKSSDNEAVALAMAALAVKREVKNEKGMNADMYNQTGEKRKGISFRLPVAIIEELKDLCSLSGKTATGWIAAAIHEAHELHASDIAVMKKLIEKNAG